MFSRCTENCAHYENHYSDKMMSALASQIAGISIFAQPFVKGQVKENIKTLRHWPLWGVDSPQEGPIRRKCFYLMTPSCLVVLWLFCGRLTHVIQGYIRHKVMACPSQCNYDVMTSSNGNTIRVNGHLCGEFTSHRWISRTKANDAELWCFLWSASE